MVPIFKNVGERSTAKSYHPVSLLSVVRKVFEELVSNRLVDHPEKFGPFSDFQYGFRSSRSTANLLTVVSDKIARAFNSSGATRVVALDISKAFDRVWHAGLLNLKSYGISGQMFGLISSFLGNGQLWAVLDGKSSQEYSVNAGFSQSSILRHLIRHLICGVNQNWLLNLNLGIKTLWTRAEVAIWFQCWKNSTGFVLACLITLVLLIRKWVGLFLKKNSSFKMLGLTFCCKLDWDSYIIFIAKTVSWIIGLLIHSIRFICSQVAPYFYKSTIQSCIEYFCHLWVDASCCYLELLDKLKKWTCGTVGPSLATSLEPLAHRWFVASLSLLRRYYFGRYSSEMAQLVATFYSGWRCPRNSNRLYNFSVTFPKFQKARLWNFLHIECFPLTYDIRGFKSRIKRHLLTVGSV